MLEAINLSKTYKSDGADYEALKNINLQIKQGDCAAIVGKSGSGKSTLMHFLAGNYICIAAGVRDCFCGGRASGVSGESPESD